MAILTFPDSDIKWWSWKAAALQLYAKQANNKTLQADALEITLRAERRLGQLLAENPLNKGGRPITTTKVEGVSIPTLKAIGIDWKLSARSQKIAKIEDDDFEVIIESAREKVTIPKRDIVVVAAFI